MSHHQTETVYVENKPVEVDYRLAPLVREMNKVGLITRGCCQISADGRTYIALELTQGMEVSVLDSNEGKGRPKAVILHWPSPEEWVAEEIEAAGRHLKID